MSILFWIYYCSAKHSCLFFFFLKFKLYFPDLISDFYWNINLLLIILILDLCRLDHQKFCSTKDERVFPWGIFITGRLVTFR